MAGSRLEKIGTIFTRTTGLIQSGALKWEDRPLWYDIYEAFPPKEEPRYDRPAPKLPLRKIFYEEDKIRAIFHNNNKRIGQINLFNNNPKYKTLTQRFVETYKTLEGQYGKDQVTEEQLYKETIEMLQKERENRKVEEQEDEISLSTAFKKEEQKETSNLNIKVSDLFKH